MVALPSAPPADRGSVSPRVLPPGSPGRGTLAMKVVNASAIALKEVSDSSWGQRGFTPLLNTRHRTVLAGKPTPSPRRDFFLH